MKKLFVCLIILLAMPRALTAQKKDIKNIEPQVSIQEAIDRYDFSLADELLNQEIARLKKKKQSTLQEEESLKFVHRAQRMMNAVEQVVFFDSLVVPRTDILPHLCLSSESGKVAPASDFSALGVSDSEATLFRSQLGDKVYFAQRNKDEVLQLMEADVYDNQPTTPQNMNGIGDDDEHHNNPFMMADGQTLYFAAQGSESLGGYDIYMTRYDVDEHVYLTPENIGMPFNSLANDYLFCIDEYYNIGCFVTDRNMPVDSVCIYYFIPNATRKVYLPDEMGSEELSKLARIHSIRDTWTDEMQVRVAANQLQLCRNEQEETKQEDFRFRVADNRICTRIEDFQSNQARVMASQWQQEMRTLEQLNTNLSDLRRQYAQAKTAQRQNLAKTILQMEERQEQLSQSIKEREKEIRRTELGL